MGTIAPDQPTGPTVRSTAAHWNAVYARNPVHQQLGWYEAVPTLSLDYIERCRIPHTAPLIDAGSGVSTLIPALLDQGYQDLYALDVSATALEQACARLEPERATAVHWVVADLARSTPERPWPMAALWHDRAVLHFLTEPTEQRAYHTWLDQTVWPGGFVILAAFAPDGAPQCSGLPVQRHDAASLAAFLGPAYQLLDSARYTYFQPSGNPRPYIYTRFKKTGRV